MFSDNTGLRQFVPLGAAVRLVQGCGERATETAIILILPRRSGRWFIAGDGGPMRRGLTSSHPNRKRGRLRALCHDIRLALAPA
jgi:hypothetical protein